MSKAKKRRIFQGLPLALKLLRRRANLSQRELAERAGTTPQVISLYERGVHDPTMENLQRILTALEMDILDLHQALYQARGEPVPPLKPLVEEQATPEEQASALSLRFEEFLDTQLLVARLEMHGWLREALEETLRRR
ncbi:MAG TPA: helix-turn-helix transcriptional regulator [Thermoanaerobaculia bacterium]|jgi:transcriptional regulator with XRE-family HTH domain